MNRLGRENRRPLWFLLTDRAYDPQRWRRLMAGVHAARADGISMTAEVSCRPIGLILGLATSLTPFSIRAGFKALADLPLAERLTRLRDPQVGMPARKRGPCLPHGPAVCVLSSICLQPAGRPPPTRALVCGDTCPTAFDPCAVICRL